MSIGVGARISNRYTVQKWIETGGMAEIYLAYDENTQREVARRDTASTINHRISNIEHLSYEGRPEIHTKFPFLSSHSSFLEL